MNSLARERVEICGHSRAERFTLTSLHLGNSTLMKYDTADDLNSEGTLTENSLVCLSYRRKRIGKYIVKRLAVGKSLLESCRRCRELGVGHIFIFFTERINKIRHLFYLFKLSFAV